MSSAVSYTHLDVYKRQFFWSLAVFIFVLLLMALVTGMDFGLGKATLWVFG